jgi:methionyl-tRNA formyltransferase
MKKKLNNLAFLCAKNSRSIAYLQSLKKNSLLPNSIILIDTKKQYRNIFIKKNIFFKNDLNISKFALDNKIKLVRLKNTKINEPECLKAVEKLDEKYIIYAANYGDILCKKYFLLKKKFIHIHPGKLPQYKGSTTYYYEILNKNSLSFSAIFQSQKIDNGRIILFQKFGLKNIKKKDLDHIYDPLLRSKILVKVISKLKKKEKLLSYPQSKVGKNTFYVIHPLLKHISILAKK